MRLFPREGRPAGPGSTLGLGVIAATALTDQATKFVADALIPLGEGIPLLPILSLYRINNTGIAFSFLAGSGLLPVVIMVAVMLVVLVMWRRTSEGGATAAVGFALIVGGATGNLIDRIRLGYVIDFLYLHLGPRPLFIFNLADAALTLGPLLLIVTFMWPHRKSPD